MSDQTSMIIELQSCETFCKNAKGILEKFISDYERWQEADDVSVCSRSEDENALALTVLNLSLIHI